MSLWNYMCVKRASSNYTEEFKLWYSYSNDINFISHMYSILILVYHSWRESTVLSPIHLMESRQLAKVQWTFVNILPNFRQWRMSCWRKSYWRRAGKPAWFRNIVVSHNIEEKRFRCITSIDRWEPWLFNFLRFLEILKSVDYKWYFEAEIRSNKLFMFWTRQQRR